MVRDWWFGMTCFQVIQEAKMITKTAFGIR
jgi:hypothetical protein